MNNDNNTRIRIRRISIRNYKGIDDLEINFPVPRMSEEPDILVMGSRNGLGKTSIIECCCLLWFACTLPEERFKLRDPYSMVNVPDLLIRAGSHYVEIGGDIVVGDQVVSTEVRMDRHGFVKATGDSTRGTELDLLRLDSSSEYDHFVNAICGFSLNPVIENRLQLYHSYRKVQEGNPELGMMVDRVPRDRRGFLPRHEFPMSLFKLILLRSMMRQADLFELAQDQEPDKTSEKLNELMSFYAGGTISKLRPSSDNTVDFRVDPNRGGDSFTFDGLSSGQKEIISTLFLIWYHSINKPSMVLIDEPELHLNPQWHRSFIKTVVELAPQNQYIMATHSEDIMESVNEDRRVLLLDS